MKPMILFVVACLLSEVALAVVFQVMTTKFYRRIQFDARSVFKGVLERVFLFVTLVNGYPHALTFFSAIKLATRLKHDEDSANQDKFNDYYLIGNMISVLAVIGYIRLWGWLTPRG